MKRYIVHYTVRYVNGTDRSHLSAIVAASTPEHAEEQVKNVEYAGMDGVPILAFDFKTVQETEEVRASTAANVAGIPD